MIYQKSPGIPHVQTSKFHVVFYFQCHSIREHSCPGMHSGWPGFPLISSPHWAAQPVPHPPCVVISSIPCSAMWGTSCFVKYSLHWPGFFSELFSINARILGRCMWMKNTFSQYYYLPYLSMHVIFSLKTSNKYSAMYGWNRVIPIYVMFTLFESEQWLINTVPTVH